MKAINHECYISLEVAKLLKEAGFDWDTLTYYPIDDKVLNERALVGSKVAFNHNRDGSAYSAPTLEVAQRWLREVKQISIDIVTGDHSEDWWFYIWGNLHTPNDMPVINGTPIALGKDIYGSYNTYEDALEAGIKKCLTLILGGE